MFFFLKISARNMDMLILVFSFFSIAYMKKLTLILNIIFIINLSKKRISFLGSTEKIH